MVADRTVFLSSGYRAPWWLPGGNLQTIYAYFLRTPTERQFQRERWDTPDGDFIDLDWLDGCGDRTRLMVLFHGLEGCSDSHYSQSLMDALSGCGWSAVVPHFRGCSGEINRLARAYHSGDSQEINWILYRLKAMYRTAAIYVVGVSLGGNMLLKWLGEQGARAASVIEKAVAVSAPVDLRATAQVMDRRWNKWIYTSYFLRTMKARALTKIATHDLALDATALRRACTFAQFDNLYTAPIHGFENANDYWHRSSSKRWLKRIQIPALIINARNDPFLPNDALPTRNEVSDTVTLEYPDSGGHVGFVSGTFPGHLKWLPRRILNFFESDKHPGSS